MENSSQVTTNNTQDGTYQTHQVDPMKLDPTKVKDDLEAIKESLIGEEDPTYPRETEMRPVDANGKQLTQVQVALKIRNPFKGV